LQELSLVQAPLARPAITHGSRQLLIAEESGSRHEGSTGGETDAA
jgi:hypothetical protein